MTEERLLRCTVCPVGCALSATVDDTGAVVSVSGNSCPRGAAYAKAELSHPVRTLTTTVFTEDGRKLPVRTDKPVAKSVLRDAVKLTKTIRVTLPARRGDVIVSDFTEPGINLIATKDMK